MAIVNDVFRTSVCQIVVAMIGKKYFFLEKQSMHNVNKSAKMQRFAILPKNNVEMIKET